MLPVDALRSVSAIVVHDECADGLASAMLLHDALPNATLSFLDYATPAHDRLDAHEGMIFCDFTPPRSRAAEFVRAGAIVLDHHRTTRDVVEGFGACGIFADESIEPGVSGAVLAYRHVWRALRDGAPEQPFVEWFARIAGVRDTWQRASADWRDASVQEALLLQLPRELWLATPLAQVALAWEQRFAWIGAAMLARRREHIDRALAGAHRFMAADGTRVIVMEGVELASEASELAPQAVVATFGFTTDGPNPSMRVSVRSPTPSFDCARFAERQGGGGHTRAAGFSIRLAPTDPQPFALLQELINSHFDRSHA